MPSDREYPHADSEESDFVCIGSPELGSELVAPASPSISVIECDTLDLASPWATPQNLALNETEAESRLLDETGGPFCTTLKPSHVSTKAPGQPKDEHPSIDRSWLLPAASSAGIEGLLTQERPEKKSKRTGVNFEGITEKEALVMTTTTIGLALALMLLLSVIRTPPRPAVYLLTWKPRAVEAINGDLERPEEDYFFNDTPVDFKSVKSPRFTLPGQANDPVMRGISAGVRVQRELLPDGKIRLLLQAKTNRGPLMDISSNSGESVAEERRGTFYVVCDDQQLLCKCWRVLVMTPGRPPSQHRRCICDPLPEDDHPSEIIPSQMTEEGSVKHGQIQVRPERMPVKFVRHMHRLFRYSYFRIADAGRVIKKIALTVVRSTKVTVARFQVTVVELFERTEPRASMLLGGPAISATKNGPCFPKARDIYAQCRATSMAGIHAAKVTVHKWSSETVQPKLREYWVWARRRLAVP